VADLPAIPIEEFSRRLAVAAGGELPPAAVGALFAHYDELRRWAPSLALVGPGVGDELFERHYAESVAGASLLPPGPGRLLDVGSGAGFPGIVLAALRPDLAVFLLEPRERKWAFLAAACRRAGLACRAVNARVSASSTELPSEIRDLSIVTVRALKIAPAVWKALAPRLRDDARVLLWSGEEFTPPGLPFVAARTLRLAGERRYIREFVRRPSAVPESAETPDVARGAP
jgi:16S rRNA (guanine527-N7)-methyltransferase